MSDDYPEQPLVLLDVNAVRNLFRPRRPADWLARLRDTVLTRVREHQLRVVVTAPLLWELTLIIDDPEHGGRQHYEEVVTFIANAAGEWFMHHEYERKRLELRHRRPLRNTEAFMEIKPVDLIRQCLEQDRIDGYRAILKTEKGRERTREAELRVSVVKELERRVGVSWRGQLEEPLTDNWERTISANARLEMRRFARQQGITLRGPQWPHPARAPTFWFAESFHMAKARHVFLNERASLTSNKSLQRMPDVLDVTHFRDAAYVHILVTDDANFTKVAKDARTELVVMNLTEFAGSLGLPDPTV